MRAGALRSVGRSVRLFRPLVEELHGNDGVATPALPEALAMAERPLDQLLQVRGAKIGAATIRLDADLAFVTALGDGIPHRSHGRSALDDAERLEAHDRTGKAGAAHDVDDAVDVLVGERRLLGEPLVRR
jgi:hypothetical protein